MNKCHSCIHCQWDDDTEIWCDIYEKTHVEPTMETPSCKMFEPQTPHTCGECCYNIKAENDGDLDFCAAHDLYDFTQDDRKACADFEEKEVR